MSTIRKCDCIALTELLPPIDGTHEEIREHTMLFTRRDIRERKADSRPQDHIQTHTHSKQHIAGARTSDEHFTYMFAAAYLPPRMDRSDIDGLLIGLDLWLHSLPKQGFLVIGGDFNTELDRESAEAALRSARGTGPRARANTHRGMRASLHEDGGRARGHRSRQPH